MRRTGPILKDKISATNWQSFVNETEHSINNNQIKNFLENKESIFDSIQLTQVNNLEQQIEAINNQMIHLREVKKDISRKMNLLKFGYDSYTPSFTSSLQKPDKIEPLNPNEEMQYKKAEEFDLKVSILLNELEIIRLIFERKILQKQLEELSQPKRNLGNQII